MPTPTYRTSLIYGDLMAMTIGFTKIVFDRVVTRHAEQAFEVDTFGKAYFAPYAIAVMIANGYDR